ncbi:hypothetical protein [Methylobacterium nonmethylotrophicum]|uniref:Helix-turn-helix domain-containing protein n=1 Tax=Methylobacterium nonmethylotrophicum TaxID=1141884 RepID=A0A4Z0NDI6_9HYPH|nr:hypothetical protein [Methylobacterium nonmethylotrophicum]TGD91808.1 hypothetical protein EU555_35520 [Methylobacterium nonmethylotrophicum]
MIYAEMKDAIARALPGALPALREQLYALNGAGRISDRDAGELDDAIEARRTAGRASPAPAPPPSPAVPIGAVMARASIFPPRLRPRISDRPGAKLRRRRVAYSGPIPPGLAERFTVGEIAVLGIVANEIAAKGRCDRSVAEIAQRAGVCTRLVQQAIKEARLQGLMSVEERKQKGGKHLTNVIRVLSREWAAWLARRSKTRGVGESKFAPLDTRRFFLSLESRAALRGSRATGFQRGDSGSGGAERAAERPRF